MFRIHILFTFNRVIGSIRMRLESFFCFCYVVLKLVTCGGRLSSLCNTLGLWLLELMTLIFFRCDGRKVLLGFMELFSGSSKLSFYLNSYKKKKKSKQNCHGLTKTFSSTATPLILLQPSIVYTCCCHHHDKFPKRQHIYKKLIPAILSLSDKPILPTT